MLRLTAKTLKQIFAAAAFGAFALTSVQAGWLCDWKSDSYRDRPWYNPACEPNWGYQITDWRRFPEQYAQQYGAGNGDYCPAPNGVAIGTQPQNLNMVPVSPPPVTGVVPPSTSTATPVIIQPPAGASPYQVPNVPATSAPYQLQNQNGMMLAPQYAPATDAPSPVMTQPRPNNLPPALPGPPAGQSFSPESLPQPGITPQLNYDPAPSPAGNSLPPLPGSAQLMNQYHQNVPIRNVSFPGQQTAGSVTFNNGAAFVPATSQQEFVLPNGQLPQWPQSEVAAFTPQPGQPQFQQPALTSPQQAFGVSPQMIQQPSAPKPSLLDRMLLRRPIGNAQDVPVQNMSMQNTAVQNVPMQAPGTTDTINGGGMQNARPFTPVMMQQEPSRNPFSLLSRALRK